MKTILVVDDMAVFREPICAALSREGFQALNASNGRDALRLAESAEPDVILLDLAMPVMDGLTCLEKIRRNPRTAAIPVILLTVLSDKETIQRAARLGVQGYLLKSRFSLSELFSRIDAATKRAASFTARTNSTPITIPRQAISPQQAGATRQSEACALSRDEILAQVHEHLDLRAIPIVLQNLLQLTHSSQSTSKEVADVVRQDHALAVKVLRVANSSLFGTGNRAKTITDAVHRIGIEGVRNAVATILTVECFHAPSQGGVVPSLFWEHSLATAIIADTLCHAFAVTGCEDIFLAGLFHDIGRLVLSDIVPDDYRQLLAAQADSLMSPADAERQAFGLDHAEMTREVLRKLDSPIALVEAAGLHESSIGHIKENARSPQKAIIVALANRLAHALVLGDNTNSMLYPLGDLTAELCLDETRLDAIVHQAANRVQETQILFASHGGHEMLESVRDKLANGAKPAPSVALLASNGIAEPCSHFLRMLGWLNPKSPRAALVYSHAGLNPANIEMELQQLDAAAARPLPLLVVREDLSCPDYSSPTADRKTTTLTLPCSYEAVARALAKLADHRSRAVEKPPLVAPVA